MTTDPVQDAIEAYSDAMQVMEPMRAQVWEERGLTVSQLRLTYLIRERDNPSLGDLASALGITGATMSGLVDRLERRGLVERVPDQIDRRVVRVRMPAEGEKVSRELQQAAREFLGRVIERMGPEAAAALARNLRQFSDATAALLAEDAGHEVLRRSAPIAGGRATREG
jgi:DNA-binding MarR family transcriptional regulator